MRALTLAGVCVLIGAVPRSLSIACLAVALSSRGVAYSPALGFEENKGQFPPDILYGSRVGVLILPDRIALPGPGVDLVFVGANPAAQWRAGEMLPGKADVFGGGRSLTGIRQYASVTRAGVYPGIDVTLNASDRFASSASINITFTVHAGADLAAVEIGLTGGAFTVSSEGGGGGVVYNGGPLFGHVYSTQAGAPIGIRYIESGGSLRFLVGNYDHTRELSVVMPAVEAALPFGCSFSVPSVSGGYAQVCFFARGTRGTGNDVAVVRRKASGEPVHLTYMTGSGTQRPLAAAVPKPWFGQPNDIVYVLGQTTSKDLSTTSNAARTSPADLFLAAIDGTTGTLSYSTYFEGAPLSWTLNVDGSGGVYVIGPLNQPQPTVTKIDVRRGQQRFRTALPGVVQAVDVDAAGHVYFAGASAGIFAGRVKADGSGVDYTVPLNAQGSAGQIAADAQGRAWIAADVSGESRLYCLDSNGAQVRLLPTPIAFSRILIDPSDNLVLVGAGDHAAKLDGSLKLLIERWYESAIELGLDADGNLVTLAADGSTAVINLAVNPNGWAAGLWNSASWTRLNRVAPGEIVTLTGSGMGPAAGVSFRLDAQNRVPVLTGGTRVLFNGVPGPVLYSQSGQVNAIVPYGVQPGTRITVQVEYQGKTVAPLTAAMTECEPGIFTLDGKRAMAFNENGSVNSDENPAQPGSIVTLFANGLGATSPASVEGAIATSTDATPTAAYSLYLVQPVMPVYAGPSPGSLSSVTQFNVRVPSISGSSSGEVQHFSLSLSAATDDRIEQSLFLSVRP